MRIKVTLFVDVGKSTNPSMGTIIDQIFKAIQWSNDPAKTLSLTWEETKVPRAKEVKECRLSDGRVVRTTQGEDPNG